MKSSDLFDILGGIDDKFYEEARLPEEEYGGAILLERHPVRGFISLMLPVAACLALAAAVMIGAEMINGRNDMVPNSSVPVIEGYPELELDRVPHISDGGDYSAMLTSISVGEYKVGLLGEDIALMNDGTLHAARLYAALFLDGELINSEEILLDNAAPDYAGYELSPGSLGLYLEHCELDGGDLIIFTDRSPEYLTGAEAECVFFTINNGRLRTLMGDHSALSGEVGSCERIRFDHRLDKSTNTIRSGLLLYTFEPRLFGATDFRFYPAYTVTPIPEPEHIEDPVSSSPD